MRYSCLEPQYLVTMLNTGMWAAGDREKERSGRQTEWEWSYKRKGDKLKSNFKRRAQVGSSGSASDLFSRLVGGREVPFLISNRILITLIQVFRGFRKRLHENTGTELQLAHNSLLLHSFQFVFLSTPKLSTLYSLIGRQHR